MATSYSVERVEDLWIVLADGRRVLSFDNEATAVAAVNDANILLLTATRDGRSGWQRDCSTGAKNGGEKRGPAVASAQAGRGRRPSLTGP